MHQISRKILVVLNVGIAIAVFTLVGFWPGWRGVLQAQAYVKHDLYSTMWTTDDNSLKCYRDEMEYDTYTRICLWCERADGNINGELFCRNEAKEPEEESSDHPCKGLQGSAWLTCMGLPVFD